MKMITNKKGLNFNMILAIAIFAITLVMVTAITLEKVKVKNRPLGTAQAAILLVATHADEALLYLDSAADIAGSETTNKFQQQGGLQRDYETNKYPCGEILNSSYWIKDNHSCIPDFEEILINMFQGFLSPLLNQHPSYDFPSLGIVAQSTSQNTTLISSIPGTFITIPFKGGGEEGFSLSEKTTFTPDYQKAIVPTTLNYGSRNGNTIQHIVVHYTAGWELDTAIATLKQKGASYHYLIDRDGQVYQYVPEEERANHAGCTKDKGPNCKGGYNSISIGISFVNRGGPFTSCQSKFNSCYEDTNGKKWEGYTQEQLDSFVSLVADITSRHDELLDNGQLKQGVLVGHSYVDPDNKNDPGPAFETKQPSLEQEINNQIATRPKIIPLSESKQTPSEQENNPLPGRGYTGVKLTHSTQERVEQYDALIEKEAEKHNIDPAFIKAFITHESLGKADAVSPTGALGLMQIIPSYHHESRCVPECGFSKEVLKEEYFDPSMNLCCGVSFIADLTKKKPLEWNCCGQNFDKGICINTVYDQPYEIAARRYNSARCGPWVDPDYVESIMGLYQFYGGNPAQFRSTSSGDYRATYEAAIGFKEEIPINIKTHELIASFATNLTERCTDNTNNCVKQELETFNKENPETYLDLNCNENAFLQSFILQLSDCLERPEKELCTINPERIPSHPFYITINSLGVWELHNKNNKDAQRRIVSQLVLPLQEANAALIDGNVEKHDIMFGFHLENSEILFSVWIDGKHLEKDTDKGVPLAEKKLTFSTENGKLIYHYDDTKGVPAMNGSYLFCNPNFNGKGLTFALDLDDRVPPPVADIRGYFDTTFNRYNIFWKPVVNYDDGNVVNDITEYRIYCSNKIYSQGQTLPEEDLSLIIKREDDGFFPPELYQNHYMVAPLSQCGPSMAMLAYPANVVVIAVDAAHQYNLSYRFKPFYPGDILQTQLPLSPPEQENEKFIPEQNYFPPPIDLPAGTPADIVLPAFVSVNDILPGSLIPTITDPTETCASGTKERRIGVFGSSSTEDGRYVEDLNTMLVGQFTNHGYTGKDTGWLRTNAFISDIITNQYDDLIIFAGINDLSTTDMTMTSAKNNLQSMYTQAKQAGMRVIAVTVQPTKGADGYWTGSPGREPDKVIQKTDELNNWIMGRVTPPLMPAIDVDIRVDAYNALEDPLNPDALAETYAAPDNLHLSQAGHEALAQAIYQNTYQNVQRCLPTS